MSERKHPPSFLVHGKERQSQPVWPCGVYVRSLTSLIIPFFLVGRSILSLWRHRSLVIEPRHGRLLWARVCVCRGAWLGGKRWVRLIAGGGVGVIAEVSPAAPPCCVTPIRHQILSHLTVPDTASLRLTPTLHPSPSLLFLAPSALLNWLDISFNLDCITVAFHLSGATIAGAPKASRAKNKPRGNTPALSRCSAFKKRKVLVSF